MDLYILDDDGRPIRFDDAIGWGEWMWPEGTRTNPRRIIARTHIRKGLEVSTVFLGMDHGFRMDGGRPTLWETMIFRNGHGDEQWRYTSVIAARAGHDAAVAFARATGRERKPKWMRRHIRRVKAETS